ncbi:MAG: dTDP-4-dehydrorhamnose 3,5-epimerase family protein [Rhodocyclaceae bacterium]|nr:dTDP-4-dehydrorhamnose 3,5-epimerase family protein [Rhodocyclaceae bacterium]
MSGDFTARPTALPGCYELNLPRSHDARGSFTKIVHAETFRRLGLTADFTEVFCTESRRGVIRGLHFQTPPHDHAKLVVCLRGRVQDAAVDLRRGSPTYRQNVTIELDAERDNALYIPTGLAHGFCTLSETATLLYFTTTPHAPTHDSGIAWDSAGIRWATDAPTLSARDRQHPALADFDSPFDYLSAT